MRTNGLSELSTNGRIEIVENYDKPPADKELEVENILDTLEHCEELVRRKANGLDQRTLAYAAEVERQAVVEGLRTSLRTLKGAQIRARGEPTHFTNQQAGALVWIRDRLT